LERVYSLRKKLWTLKPSGTPRWFLAARVFRETSHSMSQQHFSPVAPASSTLPDAGRSRKGIPRSRCVPIPVWGAPENAGRTGSPMKRNTECSFRAPPPASKPRCSHPAIWGRDPGAQSSGVGVDAYHVSMRSPSSASILELPAVAVKLLVGFFLTHIMVRRVPRPQYA